MTTDSRVAWTVGTLISSQHFQQQDRHTAHLIRRLAAATPYLWGFSDLVLDEGLMRTGSVGLVSAKGLTADGLPFDIPAETPVPALSVAGAKNQIVYLTFPDLRPGAADIGEMVGEDGEGDLAEQLAGVFDAEDGDEGATKGAGVQTRYVQKAQTVRDTVEAFSDQTTQISVAIPRARLTLGEKGLDGVQSLGVVRIKEVTPDGAAVVDPEYIAPSLSVGAAPRIKRYLSDLAGALAQQSQYLALLLQGRDPTQVGDTTRDQLFLASCTQALRTYTHWRNQPAIHPYDLFQALLNTTGDMAPYIFPSQVPGPPPAYEQDALTRSLPPLFEELLRGLSRVDQTRAQRLDVHRYEQTSYYWSTLPDSTMIADCGFYLTVRHKGAVSTLLQRFPSSITIGAGAEVQKLVGHYRGVEVEPITTPAALPVRSDWACFKLLRESGSRDAEARRRLREQWQLMAAGESSFGIHIAGAERNFEAPLEMELYAIRGEVTPE